MNKKDLPDHEGQLYIEYIDEHNNVRITEIFGYHYPNDEDIVLEGYF